MKLQLTHYGKKGIYAYLCPISIEGSDIKRGKFHNADPLDEADNKQRFYQGRPATVEFDLATFDNGYYEWKEASGHRTSTGFIEIKDGEIVKNWDTKAELLADLNSTAELPELTGSPRQIEWAEKIRSTAVLNGYPLEQARQITSAKDWIDSRSKLTNFGVRA